MEDLNRKFENLRKTEYARLGDQVYLDNTGSGLYTSLHLEKYFNELKNSVFGNPHSGNACSERMHDVVFQVRSKILQFFNITDDKYDVIFTSGATGSLRIVGNYFAWKDGSVFSYLEDNHASVVGIREIACDKGADSYCLCRKKSSLKSNFSNISSYSSTLVKSSVGKTYSNMYEGDDTPCLFAYPAQSNFSGEKYPQKWVELVHRHGINYDEGLCQNGKKQKWYVLLDAAAYAATSPLNLRQCHADFIPISFYKIFGFPTGIGALLVRKGSENVLCNKKFFGGGAVSGWLASHAYCKAKPVLHDRLEDGTIPFLGILALKHGFDSFNELGLGMHCIQEYTHNLWRYLYDETSALKHANGSPVVEIYATQSDVYDISNQGPILAFNIRRSDGSYVGFNTVLQLANSNNIYLRGGCFCNVGACGTMLNASSELLLKAFESGHVCGDGVDIVKDKPIGALRISLGPSSTMKDIKTFVEFLSGCFQQTKMPSSSNKILETNGSCQDIVLEEMFIYPVKSCQGMPVDNWEISNTGLKFDRMWMIVDDHGICMNLKKNPALVSIFPAVSLAQEVLILKADGMEPIEIPFIYDDEATSMNCDVGPNQQCLTKVCGDKVEGLDCGARASLWLSEVIGTTCSLLQKKLRAFRYSKKEAMRGRKCEISLVNEAQYLLVNKATVQYLYRNMNEYPHEDCQDEIEDLAKRFRGNFVVSGASAFSEDAWTKITMKSPEGTKYGDEELKFVKRGLCNRCSMICVDPNTGRKLSDPLKSLTNFKLPGDKCHRKPTFGIYLQCETASSTIRVKSKLFLENQS